MYRNNDIRALGAMDRFATGNYGEDSYPEERDLYCDLCGENLIATNCETVYTYGGYDCLCADCFSQILFEDFEGKCGTKIEDWDNWD